MKIMWFCIPAYGHTNPTIGVVKELVKRGHEIWYYSFQEFQEKIEKTGAAFIPCDRYLPPLNKKSEKRLRKVSTTEMSIQAFRTTALLDEKLTEDIRKFQPALIVSDSVCFWGKLIAKKHHLPMICSTTTFAFNQYSSKYMRYSFAEMADMILGIPKLNREIEKLRPLGYQVKSALDIVQNKEDMDTIVYTSEKFQPFGETFPKEHYCFTGPSVEDVPVQEKNKKRPFIYISLGTVINTHPEFYNHCIQALKDADAEVLISCGKAFAQSSLEKLPDNIQVEAYVNQMEVLSRASLFITHCGMNSASEGLYMGVPELLFPLTGEQQAVARRVCEMGAGKLLTKEEAANPAQLKKAVESILSDEGILRGALLMRENLTACGGAKAAADFVESRLAMEG